MNVIGVDLALGTTGIAMHTGGAEQIVTASTMRPPVRWRAIRAGILDACQAAHDASSGPPVVVLEDLPSARLAGAGKSVGQLGMVHGVVRLALDDLVQRLELAAVVLVQPASMKRYATGNGNANKQQVLVEAVKRLDYQGADDNEADALWLRQMGLAHYMPEASVKVPVKHLEALRGVEWPELLEVSA